MERGTAKCVDCTHEAALHQALGACRLNGCPCEGFVSEHGSIVKARAYSAEHPTPYTLNAERLEKMVPVALAIGAVIGGLIGWIARGIAG